jgi:hypothetical protein
VGLFGKLFGGNGGFGYVNIGGEGRWGAMLRGWAPYQKGE